jgi:hypothetical protein
MGVEPSAGQLGKHLGRLGIDAHSAGKNPDLNFLDNRIIENEPPNEMKRRKDENSNVR